MSTAADEHAPLRAEVGERLAELSRWAAGLRARGEEDGRGEVHPADG